MTSATRSAVAALGCLRTPRRGGRTSAPLGVPFRTAMTVLAVAVLALGILTVLAAVGIAGGHPWGVPLALVTRAIDVLGALPGLAEGPGEVAAVATVLVVSAVAAVLVLRLRRVPSAS